MALEDMPQLGSVDFEALLAAPSLSEDPLFSVLDQPPPAWMMEPNPAGLDSQLFPGMPPVSFAPDMPSSSTAALPDMFLDPFLMPLPDFVPLPAMGVDTFMPPPIATSSDGSGGTGAASSSGGAPQASGAPAAAPAPARRARASGGGRKELSEEQKERIRAKNRRAQNRYREKQKAKAAATEQDYSEVAAELERMRLEHDRLQDQHEEMQRVLLVRDTAVEALETSKAEDEAEATAAIKAGGSCLDLAKAMCPSSSGPFPAASVAAAAGKGGPQPFGSECPLTGLTLSQIAELKKTPPEVLQQNWKGIVQRLEELMQQQGAAATSSDPTLAVRTEQLDDQLRATLREGQLFCFEHAVYQPGNVQKLFAASLDDGRSQIKVEDMQHWEGVATMVQLDGEQLERLTAARSRFLQAIDEVCVERQQIFARLQAVQVPTSLRAMQEATASWLEVHEATAELTANMAREHCVCMTFVRDAFGYVFTPRQKALAAIHSYPFFPDVYSISTAALQAAGALAAGEQYPLLPSSVPAAAAPGVAVAVN